MAEDCKRPVSRWSDAERLEWGMKEDALRQEELKMACDEASLRGVQERARKRRNAVGASRGQAIQMVLEAQQHKKRINLTRIVCEEKLESRNQTTPEDQVPKAGLAFMFGGEE